MKAFKNNDDCHKTVEFNSFLTKFWAKKLVSYVLVVYLLWFLLWHFTQPNQQLNYRKDSDQFNLVSDCFQINFFINFVIWLLNLVILYQLSMKFSSSFHILLTKVFKMMFYTILHSLIQDEFYFRFFSFQILALQ